MTKRKKLIPAVSLIRMSSSQQEASPDQQRAENKKLEKRYGCRTIREYFDDSVSGDATSKRKGFQRLIRDAKQKRDFQVIFCWDQDRFGRFDSIEAGYWIKPLRDAGVRLITFAQGEIDWNDFTGRMMYAIQQEGKHQYLIDLSRNSLRGIVAVAKRGEFFNKPPYGYDKVFYDPAGDFMRRAAYGEKFSKPKDWRTELSPSENAEEPQTIRWLFNTFVNTDCSMRWLAMQLNARGIRTRTGKSWKVCMVKKLLRHPVYKGTYTFGRHSTAKYFTVGKDGELIRPLKNTGKLRSGCAGEAPILIENAHEALVPPEVFDRVQEKLRSRQLTRTKPRNSVYLLAGVIRCGHCGGPMIGRRNHNGNRVRYYVCAGQISGTCAWYSIRLEEIEGLVLQFIDQQCLLPDVAKRIKEGIRKQAAAERAPDDLSCSLKQSITALENKIRRGTENLALADKRDLADLSQLLAEWREERDRLQNDLDARASSKNGNPKARAKDAVAQLSRLREQLRSGEPMKVRAIVKGFIERIEVWWSPNGKRRNRVARMLFTCQNADPLLGGISRPW